jgi:hypothetical protein
LETATETATPTASPTLPMIATEPALNLLFADNFDGGDLSRWTLGAGWQLVASEAGQALQVNGSDEGVKLVQGTLGDSAVQLRYILNAGMARLRLRQSAAGAYTLLVDMNGSVSLYRGDQILGAATVSAKPISEWRTVRLLAVGNRVRAAIDGVEVIAVQDAAPLPAGTLFFGGVGLAAGALRVDDVAVWGILFMTEQSEQSVGAVVAATGNEISGVGQLQAGAAAAQSGNTTTQSFASPQDTTPQNLTFIQNFDSLPPGLGQAIAPIHARVAH